MSVGGIASQIRVAFAVALLSAGAETSYGAATISACRLDGSRADAVTSTLNAAANAYAALGKPLPFDTVVVNPKTATLGPRTLAVYIIADASRDNVTPQGCAKGPIKKDEQLDELSVRGGCLVVAVDHMEIRCSAEAVNLFGEVRERPGRAHPALLYVLSHELGHLYQQRVGEYFGRMERIELRDDAANKLRLLRDACDPVLTKREEEADALAIEVLIRLLSAPPYREPLFSERGSLYWNVDQLYLAANAWQKAALEREFISQPRAHVAFEPTEFPTPKQTIENNAKRFVCDVLTKHQGVVIYPGRSVTHPALEQRMRKIAEALKPIAEALPNAGAKQEFKSIAVLQEQVSPIFNHIYRETGVYLEAVQASICTRVNGNRPTANC